MRDKDQDMWDQDMDMGNQDTDTGPLGLGEDWEEWGHRGPGPGCEGIRIQETRTVTWGYCDQDVGVQDTDMGDWDRDARDLRLKQVAGTRTGACRDTGDQDQGGGDQERDTARPGHRGRCMARWGWGLGGSGPAPGEPGHRAPEQEHGELEQGHRGTGTSTGTWSNQDTDLDREQGTRTKKLGNRTGV